MSDIKLFRLGPGSVDELRGESVQIEKSLQTIFENNLEALLGVRFLASEHSTGPVHGGRIDTLGLDEDDCPVIIEYKRAVNENVINQGLFYLDWLLDHRKEFQWLVLERLGAETAKEVDWSTPRLLCIAGDFTRYDEHAVNQIARNIELLRYQRFGDDLLMLELVHVPKQSRTVSSVVSPRTSSLETQPSTPSSDPYLTQRIAYRIAQSSPDVRDLYEAIRQYLVALGDDVQVKELLNYIAFKRIKNFACLEVYPQAKVVTVYLKVDPRSITVEEGFTRDVSKIGHFGTGDLSVSLRTMDDLKRAIPLFDRSYQES
jgi:predicted transport protein